MSTAITTPSENSIEIADQMIRAGWLANHFAAQGAFIEYRERKARNTISRQDDDLMRFSEYLNTVRLNSGATVDELLSDEDLSTTPQAWHGVTWGLVDGFVKWQLLQGNAIGSVNVRLSTIKTYAKLAMKAGTLTPVDYAMIRAVQGYRHTEGKHVDEEREVTRRGSKKAEATTITPEQAAQLKTQPDTPQGRRDAVMMGLMLNLGLRVGEVVGLRVKDVDVKAGYITFYREKVDKAQTHQLINGLWTSLKAYFDQGDVSSNPDAPLLRASSKHGTLTTEGMTRFGIAQRVRQLGDRINLDHLSPHDLRHYWATSAARNKTPIDRLQDAGGWSSPAMPLRYIEAADIANKGIKLE